MCVVFCIHRIHLPYETSAQAEKQQGSSANSPKPEPARAQTPCAKQSPLPSSRDGPPSLLMPPSPPLQQVCYARRPPPTTTWMASSHHAAKSSPTCHVSPLPQPNPSPLLRSMAWIWLVAWRLTSTTVQNRDLAEKRSEEKKKIIKKNPPLSMLALPLGLPP